ncbi:hypothetical protein CEXT_328641 [Caerostris extrusa]|uniref:Uncharacterized protein n=1 Tax=Caerostris extrusa TaxID=172846 RepID=A0AAV4S5P4_CAEEX|nr:hypothetical protein CEXT_328641 [Caerostris extrusa]
MPAEWRRQMQLMTKTLVFLPSHHVTLTKRYCVPPTDVWVIERSSFKASPGSTQAKERKSFVQIKGTGISFRTQQVSFSSNKTCNLSEEARTASDFVFNNAGILKQAIKGDEVHSNQNETGFSSFVAIKARLILSVF